MEQATKAQIAYAQALLSELGYDLDERAAFERR